MTIRIWAILAVVLFALPALASAQGVGGEQTSDWVTISANPAEIPADGNSTSKIIVVVSHSEVCDDIVEVPVTMSTSTGWLTDVGNGSNIGTTIDIITDKNGTVNALLSGNETGTAVILLNCGARGWNKTEVTFLEPGTVVTATTSGNGVESESSEVEVSSNATATPAAVNETITPTASPEASHEATPTPTTTPTETPKPTSKPTTKPSTPGFEAVFAIAGLLAVTYLVRWRRRD
jgi:PGF-CTERM protein